MRTFTTITSRLLAEALVRAENPGSNPNEAPNEDRVLVVRDRVFRIAKDLGYDWLALTPQRVAIVQEAYLEQVSDGAYDSDNGIVPLHL